METPTKENLVGAKPAPTVRTFIPLVKENQVSLVLRTFLSDPGSDSKTDRLGGWRWKNDYFI